MLTVAIQLAARAFGHGENGIGWLLMLPWFAIYTPAVMLALAVGVDCRVGDVYGIHAGLFLWMIFVNGVTGAVLGLIVRRIYGFFKRVGLDR
jgi:hypothetical protein